LESNRGPNYLEIGHSCSDHLLSQGDPTCPDRVDLISGQGVLCDYPGANPLPKILNSPTRGSHETSLHSGRAKRRALKRDVIAVVFLRGCLAFALWLPIGAADANEVTDWNVIMEQTATASSAEPSVILSGRNVSLMHLAMHDALNAISRRHESYGVYQRSSPGANPQAAVVAAGYGVTVRLYPDQASSLDNIYSKMLATIPDGPSKNEGLVLGDGVAAAIVAFRAEDHFDYANIAEPFVSGTGPYGAGPGAWLPAPDSPHQNAYFSSASLVAPLVLTSPSQFRNLLPGPLKLSSGNFFRQLEEVRMLAGKTSTARTSEQTTIALLWGDPSMFRVFNEIARNLISARKDDLWESARTLALLNVAIADSYIAVFEAKYYYQFWRPTMAIRGADTDGNEKTNSDQSWLPLLPTPPFPEYPSGHSAACGSAQTILESAFGRNTPFTATSTLLPGYGRNFSNFDEASRECVDGRMLSGAHFRFSDEDALYLGQHISRYVLRTILADP
jgi:hypothetical protein